MVRKLYQQFAAPKRLLSLEEIASACNVSTKRVREWLGADLIRSQHASDRYIDAMEASLFMLRNKLPVPTRLLPPRTKKVLVVAGEGSSRDTMELWAERIGTAFAGRYNILLETVAAGTKPELAILTHRPDLVAILLSSYNRKMAEVLTLLANEPAVRTLLVVDAAVHLAVERGELQLPADAIVADDLDSGQVAARIAGIFD